MQIVGFVGFILGSHIILMQIFKITTYHIYFLKALPLLVGYSVLVGWLLYSLELHAFFLWQVVFASGWLFLLSRKQAKQNEVMLDLAGGDAEDVRFMASSVSKTRQYYTYSSFIYVICFSATYLWLINT
jgi:hypothetical protein